MVGAQPRDNGVCERFVDVVLAQKSPAEVDDLQVVRRDDIETNDQIFVAQTSQNYADLLLAEHCYHVARRISRTFCSAVSGGPSFCPMLVPLVGYNEPEILPSSRYTSCLPAAGSGNEIAPTKTGGRSRPFLSTHYGLDNQ